MSSPRAAQSSKSAGCRDEAIPFCSLNEWRDKFQPAMRALLNFSGGDRLRLQTRRARLAVSHRQKPEGRAKSGYYCRFTSKLSTPQEKPSKSRRTIAARIGRKATTSGSSSQRSKKSLIQFPSPLQAEKRADALGSLFHLITFPFPTSERSLTCHTQPLRLLPYRRRKLHPTSWSVRENITRFTNVNNFFRPFRPQPDSNPKRSQDACPRPSSDVWNQ